MNITPRIIIPAKYKLKHCSEIKILLFTVVLSMNDTFLNKIIYKKNGSDEKISSLPKKLKLISSNLPNQKCMNHPE